MKTIITSANTFQVSSGDEILTFKKKCNLSKLDGGIRITDRETTMILNYGELLAPSSLSSNDELFTFLHELIMDDDVDYSVQQAKRVLEDQGIYTSVSAKAKNLLKFGFNSAISDTVYSTIQTFPNGEDQEVFLTDNLITHFASTSNNDSGIPLTIEGHTVQNGKLSFVVQTVNCQGQTKTALTTPLRGATRVYNSTTGENNLVGTVYVSEDVSYSNGVPSDSTKVHIMIAAGAQQSQKLSTSISYNDAWFVTNIGVDVAERASLDMTGRLLVREYGSVFREQKNFALTTNNGYASVFEPYVIIPPNHDVKVDAISSSNNRGASGNIQGYLAKVIAR